MTTSKEGEKMHTAINYITNEDEIKIIILILLKILLKNKFNFPIIQYQDYIKSNKFKNECSTDDFIFNANAIETIKNKLNIISERKIVKDAEGNYITNDKYSLIELLRHIIDEYGWDYNTLFHDFKNNIDKTLALKNYAINELKHIPFITMEYLNNENFIKDIVIEPLKWNVVSLKLYRYIFDKSFSVTVDLTLMDNIFSDSKIENIENKNKSKIKRKRVKFSKNIQKLYSYILKRAKQGCFIINKSEMAQHLDTRSENMDSTVSRLKEQYREMYNKDTNYEIIYSSGNNNGDYSINKDLISNIRGY